jgi:ribosomal protein S18 acetylase RimI-like enzyme
VAYDDNRRAVFTEVIQATYEGSLDCVSLNRRRDIEDVLASHRAAGQFDPRHWLVGLNPQRKPVGVLLLAMIAERWACEVVYLGLLPAWRGRGLGGTLISKTLQVAREMAANTISLTVDARNLPARRLYEACSFRETSARDAWIRFL